MQRAPHMRSLVLLDEKATAFSIAVALHGEVNYR